MNGEGHWPDFRAGTPIGGGSMIPPYACAPPRSISYRAGYKYQLAAHYHHQTHIIGLTAETGYLYLAPTGRLTIRDGYAWDGCSGPTWDTPSNQRAGLVHDALTQLIRLGMLDRKWITYAAQELRRIMLEDGAWRIRAWYYERSVLLAGDASTRPHSERPIIQAP